MPKIAKFDFPVLHVHVTFWYKLEKMKLDVYKLDDTPKQIVAWHGSGDLVPAAYQIDGDSFSTGSLSVPDRMCHAILENVNTVEDFKTRDRKQLLLDHGQALWDDIVSRRVLDNPALLSRMVLLTYADLKGHVFRYNVAFPCVLVEGSVEMKSAPVPAVSALGAETLKNIYTSFKSFRAECRDAVAVLRGNELKPFKEYTLGDVVVTVDTSTSPEAAGWMTRNLLTTLNVLFGTQEVRVLCLREALSRGTVEPKSIVVDYVLPAPSGAATPPSPPKVFGWGDGKMSTVNLSSMMDPIKLADSSANLNLSLMKWRMVPDLDLEKIASQRCLIVGSGTLGCNVARHLLMWGVKTMTFVDRGTVSYSNPVRQSLFVHSDAVERKNKAQAAAEGVKRIHPSVNATHVSMSIPMPGHPFDEAQRQDIEFTVKELDSLVQSHDVIFLLMDSRESRWLPTLLGAHYRKTVINAALGFDSWVVMRHGVAPESDGTADAASSSMSAIRKQRLGCYFCSDVLAPRDSLTDRTLDQQCTVTRPAVSALASAYAVELFAGIVNHPKGSSAPPAMGNSDDDADCTGPLGLLPQQIRGNVYSVDQVMMLCGYFPKCIACSDVVTSEYAREGFEFIAQCLNDPECLEELTGIKKDLEAIEHMDCSWEDDDI
eukprot:PhM_4_TR17232/c0_g1_i1/m.5589/K08337/ATG7; ubiquitin-like modifier-activating enzyme ATG7